MNSKRNPKCHLLNDWKEQIVHIGDEQVSLQNQFDNLRNDFSDNSPRLDALETGLNSLDGRVIITETDIISNTDRITANENDIDRIDAELVNKTGDINALANRVTLAEGDIDNIDARLIGIETGEILYSQLTMDADKDFGGKAIINPGLVDGVDVGSHTHSGTAGQGAKINLKDVEVSEDKNFGGKTLNNITDAEIKGTIHFKNSLGQMKFYYPTGEQFCSIQPRPTEGRYFQIYSHATDDAGFKFGVSKYGDVEVKRNVLMPVNGVVDGVDISEHTHDGTAIGGKKVSLLDVGPINTLNGSVYAGNDTNGSYKVIGVKRYINEGLSEASLTVDGNRGYFSFARDGLNRGQLIIDKTGYVLSTVPLTIAGAITGASVSASGAITQNNGMQVASCPTTFSKSIDQAISGNSEVTIYTVPAGRTGLSVSAFDYMASSINGRNLLRLKYVYDDDTATVSGIIMDTNDPEPPENPQLLVQPIVDCSGKKYIKAIKLLNGDAGTCQLQMTIKGYLY